MENIFSLTIRLGNDAMQTPADIAAALRDVADRLADGYDPVSELGPHEGVIRDVNGNRVGTWEAR